MCNLTSSFDPNYSSSMTQAFIVFLEELGFLWEVIIRGQEANVEQKQESIHITIRHFFSNMNLKLFGV